MSGKLVKKFLVWVMVVTMFFSNVPIDAFAATDDHAHEHSEEVSEGEEEATPEENSEEDLEEPSEEEATLEEDSEEESEEPGEEEATPEEGSEEESEEPGEEATPEEDSEEESEEPGEEESIPEEMSEVQKMQQQIDELVTVHGLSADMTDDEIANVIFAMDGNTLKGAYDTCVAIEEQAKALSLEELEILVQNSNTEAFAKFYLVMQKIMTPELSAASGNHTPVEDVEVAVSGASDNSMSNGTVTVTAKGNSGIWGFGASSKTATAEVINKSSESATISFSWKATNVHILQIDGTTYTAASGNVSKTLAAGDKITFTITTDKNSTTNKLELSGFDIQIAQTESNVTFEYDSSLGNVSVAEGAIESGVTQKVSATGVALVATPKADAKFIAWVDATNDNKILSKSSNYTLAAGKDMTVKAVFSNSSTTAYFAINNDTFYEDLSAAVAASANSDVIMLLNDGVLKSGTYTIPSGVTLLIPFDDNETGYITAPGVIDGANETIKWVPPTPYRTLTMAEGAQLIVNGAMSVSANQYAAGGGKQNSGSPTGEVGFVNMHSGSSITVNSGAGLYAYGYIVGEGTVLAKSGAVVYECFQIEDFRGGSAITSMSDRAEGVFPFSQYYVQNIEVPLTLESGAVEYSYTSFTISYVGITSASVAFISNSGAMFNLKNGSVTKRYDGETDRLIIEADGAFSVEPINLSLKLSIIGSTSIKTEKFELPITSNISVLVNSGSIDLKQDVALLPGAEVYIAKGAECILGSGNSFYIYDAAEWGDYVYINGYNKKLFPVNYAYGRIRSGKTRTDADLVDAKLTIEGTVDASAGAVYTTAGGAAITGVEGARAQIAPGTQSVTYQCTQKNTDVTYVEIPITPAKLKNGDGTYTETNVSGTYVYKSGFWHEAACKAEYTPEVIKPSTCLEKGLTKYTCKCTAHTPDSYEEVTAISGHTEVVDKGYAATCTEAGLTDGKHCSVCNELLVSQETIDALGHHYENVGENSPTCTEPGDIFYRCSGCQDEYTEDVPATGHMDGNPVKVYIEKVTCTTDGTYAMVVYCVNCEEEQSRGEVLLESATGHTPEETEGFEPTCTATGLTTGEHCSVCNEVLKSRETIPALGHKEIVLEAVAPTCTEKGYKEGVGCSVCNAVITEQEEIAATGHTNGAPVTENTVEPTCTEAGSQDIVVYCTVCNAEVFRDAATIPATGHTNGKPVTENEVQATCSAEGSYDTVIYCTVCSKEVSRETKQTGKTAHTEAELEAVDPTCTNTGLTEGLHCSVCNEVLAAQVEIPALGHKSVTDKGSAATCTEAGLTDGSHCSVCNEVLTAQTEIPALGHTEGAEATCTTSQTCTVCGTELKEALGHTEVTDEAVNPTCTNTGLTAGTHCSVCNEVLTAQEEVPMLPHTNAEAVVENKVEATCTEAGSQDIVVYCTVCNAEVSRNTEAIEATGHTKAEAVVENQVEPTCTTAGGYDLVIYCSVCNAEVSRGNVAVSATDHTEGAEATCTSPQICTVCKVVLQKELGHDYKETVLTVPTCTAEGTSQFTCAQCQDSYEEAVPATGHDWYSKPAKDPTCTETGIAATQFCINCGAKEEGGVIPALRHNFDNGVVMEQATCAKEGTMKYTCTRKNCSETTTEAIAKLPHTEEVLNAVEATCTETGLTAGKHCSVCKEVLEAQEVIEALGHTEVTDKAVDSTCTETGLTAGTHCSVCNEVLTAQEVVAALGHTEVVDEAVEATCTEAGLTAGTHCSVCNEVLTAQEAVEALGHTEVVDEAVAATCTEAGLTAGTHCSVCNEVLEAQEAVQALGHTEVVDEAVEATCTEAGLTAGKHCSVCNEVLEAQEEIPAAGHTNETLKAAAATCTEPGRTAGVKCSVCNEILVEQQEIPAKGHTEVIDAAVAATCTTAGLTEGKHCSVCNEVLAAQETVEALGHKEEVLTAVEATCTATGLTAGKKCTVCNVTTEHQTIIPATGHTTVADAAKAPTCTATGLTAGSHCSVCGETLAAQEEIPAKGHTEAEDRAVAPTCTATGLTAGKHCSVCKEVLTAQEVVEALGHTEVIDEAVAATCTEAGLTVGTHCSVCKEVLTVQETVPAFGHTEVMDPAVEPTCTEPGLTEGSHCEVCSKVFVAQRVIKSNGHTIVIDAVVEPTCTEPGFKEGKHCSVCNEVLVVQEVVEALGHKEVIDAAVEPTCKAAGLTEGTHCSVCNETLAAQEEIPMLEHQWNYGRVTTDPLCEKDGVLTYTCLLCEDTKTEVLPMLGHELESFGEKKPTYTAGGWKAYEKCTRCDYSTYEEVPALGEPVIETYDEFIENLVILEELADYYVKKVSPGKDPAMLIIKYIRTGVDRYNSGSWNIMAGYEDADFAKFVKEYETKYNLALEDGEELMAVTGLKNIETFNLPNGDHTDIGHMFGTMDISYTNSQSVNHADVAGWGGDLADLLSLADQFGVKSTEFEDMVAEVSNNYLLKDQDEFSEKPTEGTFSETDVRGDLDGYYVMDTLYDAEYEKGTLTNILTDYFTVSLTDEDRADYFLKNRLGGVSLRSDVRNAVYNEYVGNSVIATLESTREYKTKDLATLRKACCYAFADYICKLAGDFVEIGTNEYFTVFQTASSMLAPGITQTISSAKVADGKQMDFYVTTADVTRSDVSVYANYHNNDPSQGWAMQRVSDQAKAAQERHGNPESEHYIENYNVVAAINGDGYNMSTGEPGGLLVMEGKEWHKCGGNGFFAILADGTAVIGSKAEYEALAAKGLVKEALGAFGTTLVVDGKINVSNSGGYDRASRTAIGITATGKVVFLVVDGRQGEYSCGASFVELAQIMLEAGCVEAVNLDGGGSSTYCAKPEGENEIRVINSPSDGIERSVSTSMIVVSTAVSDTAFDHAVVSSDYTYLTPGSTAQLSAKAVTATGNGVDMPKGVYWTVADETIGTVSEDGVFTAVTYGETKVSLMLDGESVGTKTLYIVNPDNVYFEKDAISAVYGKAAVLPVKAVYEGKAVSINEQDVVITAANPAAGTVEGFAFIGNAEFGARQVKVVASLVNVEGVTGSMTVLLYNEDEVNFDFENAAGGDYQLAWERKVSNAVETNKNMYDAVNKDEEMVTEYTFAIDMSKISIPEQLEDLTYMLPGADLADASAWGFLLQLAERISVLTKVEPQIVFDPNFEVDYSELTISNEYFELKDTKFDEETNTLTLSLNWIDQVAPIDPDTANPLCILSGIKLTPKDHAWENTNRIAVNNVGKISYDIYLRTSALYTFACKEENQKIYGIYPFDNADVITDAGTTEKGGHFADVYKEFADSYTLSKENYDGWTIVAGGWAYYVDGVRVTGMQIIDGMYYMFNENGINLGQTKYTGEYKNEEGKEYYIRDGVPMTEWIRFGENEWRYYNPETGIREKVTVEAGEHSCIIDTVYTFTSESGAVKVAKHDDAGGHEYVKQEDGSYKCSACGFVRINLEDTNVSLSYYLTSYTGEKRVPTLTVTTADGKVLDKPTTSEYPDYYGEYLNNIEVGTATVKVKAYKPAHYVNITEYRGNCAGEQTVYFEIRPDKPTDVVVTNDSKNPTISWTASKAPGVTYVIYSKYAADEEWTEFATTTETSYALDAEKDGGRTFKLAARKEVEGKVYESISCTSVVSLGLVVEIGNREDGKPTLDWYPIEGAVSYEVYRATKEDGKFTKVYTTDKTAYTHTSATDGKTYYYKVVAVFENGKTQTSDVEKNICVVAGEFNILAANRKKDGKPTLKWSKMEGAVSYEILRSTKKLGKYTKVFTTEKLTYTHASATPGKSYFYKVRAVYADGKKETSDVITNKCQVVGIKLNLVAGNRKSDGKPRLTWDKTGAVSYEIYRSTSKAGTYKKIFTTDGLSFTNTSALQGRTYFYKVKATFHDGTVVYSDVVYVKALVTDLDLDVKVKTNLKGKPKVTWKDLGDATYVVYRSTSKKGTYKKMYTTTGTTYINTSAKKGKTYYYKVKVTFADGTKSTSDVVSVKCKK